MSTATDTITFSPGTEEWFEHGPPGDRRRVAFHDYAAIYAEPGLYERVFSDGLGMCSAQVVPALYGEALAALARDPAEERVLEVGAGNGMAGTTLRELGVGGLVGVDLEPAAASAAERDRPGTYDDYLVGDVSGALRGDLQARGCTAMLAVAAVGTGHMPPAVLRAAIGLVAPGGLVAFAVTPALAGDSTDPAGVASGYPALMRELIDPHLVASRTYVHRRQTDGTPHEAVAVVARRP